MRYWWRVIGAGLLTRALNSLTSSGGLDVTYESLKLTTKVRGLLDARGSSLSGGCDSGGSGGSGVHVHFPVFSAVVAEEVAAEANAQELAHAGDVEGAITAAEVASGGGGRRGRAPATGAHPASLPQPGGSRAKGRAWSLLSVILKWRQEKLCAVHLFYIFRCIPARWPWL